MDEIKIYDFMLQLNTFLNRQNLIVGKLINEIQTVGSLMLRAKSFMPPETFDEIFTPMLESIQRHQHLLEEMGESGVEFNSSLTEFYDLFKGKPQ